MDATNSPLGDIPGWTGRMSFYLWIVCSVVVFVFFLYFFGIERISVVGEKEAVFLLMILCFVGFVFV